MVGGCLLGRLDLLAGRRQSAHMGIGTLVGLLRCGNRRGNRAGNERCNDRVGEDVFRKRHE